MSLRGQLPLSAFFESSSSKGSAGTRQPKVTPKRKHSSPAPAIDLDDALEPPKKKHKQKENIPSRRHSFEQANKDLGEQHSSSRSIQPATPKSSTMVDTHPEDGGSGAKAKTFIEFIDLTMSSSDDDSAQTGAQGTCLLASPPLTPTVAEIRRDGHQLSLPSPPPTLPDTKRVRKRRVSKEGLEQTDPADVDAIVSPSRRATRGEGFASPSSRSATVPRMGNVEDKEPFAPPSPQKSRELMHMPPPPLPDKVKVLFPAMPNLPSWRLRKPRSSDSDKWVPSSQSQEKSIPRYEYHQASTSDDAPHAYSYWRPEPEIVPSSQSPEREDEMTLPSDPVDEHPPLFPMHPLNSSHGPGESVDSVGSTAEESLPSPETVESSQSQFETEITSEMVEAMGARIPAMGWLQKVASPSEIQSSSPRSVETQDYDANDELSSQETHSQPSTFDMSDPRTSPLLIPSQLTDAFGFFDSQTWSRTPSPVRRFRETFVGRDERGNVLPTKEIPDRSRPPSPDGDVLDEITGSPLPIPESDFSDYSFSQSGSLPMSVKNFCNMFSEDEPSPLEHI